MIASTSSGNTHSTAGPGIRRYQIISRSSTRKAIAKSTSGPTTAASGTSKRGKYTFEMTFCCPTSEVEPVDNAVEKYVHGTSAHNEKRGYGTPSDGIRANFPKKIVNTTIDMTGWTIAHPAPSVVCL